jgi:hypothetical protein
MYLGLRNGPFMPLNLIPVQGSPVPLLFQTLNVLWVQEKEPNYACLSEARASHSQRVWAEVSSSAPHLLHKRLLVSLLTCRCFLRVLCLVRRPITTLDCVLLKDRSLVFGARTRSRNHFSGRSLGTDKTPSDCHRLVFHPASLSFFLYSATDPQGRLSSYTYMFEQNRLLQTSQQFNFVVLQHVQGPNTAPQCAE